MSHSKQKNILFQLSGSIAAYKACEVISQLVKQGYDVKCVTTPSTQNFIGLSTLEGLTGNPVFSNTFDEGQQMDHIHLIRWADLIILCPATASTINKMAAGIGDDPVSLLFLAHQFDKPYLVAPAMNSAMYQHPATASSLNQLQDWGVKIIEPDSGELACGEVGIGRLASPDTIFSCIQNHFSSKNIQTQVLITFGGTEEPIDSVRTISNFSSGATGAFLTDELCSHGFNVTALASEKATKPKKYKSLVSFQAYKSFSDLDLKMQTLLSQQSFDWVIHLAAVSDFSMDFLEVNGKKVKTPEAKISSSSDICIHLKPNHKIVDRIKTYSKNKKVKVIAFKLTKTDKAIDRLEQINKLLASPAVDFVVHNELSEINAVQHPHSIYSPRGIIMSGNTKREMAKGIRRTLSESQPTVEACI